MKTNKIKLMITVEVLSYDSISAIIQDVMRNFDNEKRHGSLSWEDGDNVVWNTEYTLVDF